MTIRPSYGPAGLCINLSDAIPYDGVDMYRTEISHPDVNSGQQVQSYTGHKVVDDATMKMVRMFLEECDPALRERTVRFLRALSDGANSFHATKCVAE